MNDYLPRQHQIDSYLGGADQIVIDSILDETLPRMQYDETFSRIIP
jgi:hypothetical protein